MGAVRLFRNTSLPSPGALSPDEVRYVKVGSSYIQYVVDNSGVALPPAVIAHTHPISDITGLQTALDGKSDTSHTHANATTSVAGFMSAADKVKIDGLSNYTHPDSGVSAGTYRSVTVNAQGHVTAGTNPTTLAGYGITQKYVSLDPADGFATPVQSSYDLNTIALTSYGYATTATNRPTGAAANGYFSTNAIDSTSFFQTFANPTVQDAFFYRRKNTSTLYAWLQVASREWVTAEGFLKGSGTIGRVPVFTATAVVGDSLLSISGVNVTAIQGQFVSDIAPASGPRGMALQNGTVRWVVGKFGNETGSNAGSDLVYQRYNDSGVSLGTVMTIVRATGETTFTGTVAGATPTASGHLTTKAYVDAAISGVGGITGTGSVSTIAMWSSGTNLTVSSLTEDTDYVSTTKGGKIGNNGSNRYIQTYHNAAYILLSFQNAAATAGWTWGHIGDDFNVSKFGSPGNGNVFTFYNDGNFKAPGQILADIAANANARGYVLQTTALNRWILGKAGLETGSDAGSDLVLWRYSDAGSSLGSALTIVRATGNATFSGTITATGGNSTNWNTSYGWGNHASAGYALTSALSGYVPTSRTITINGTTLDLSANRSWTISAGVGGSGTAGRIPQFATSTTLSDSILSVSGINVTAIGGQFVSDIAPAAGPRGMALQNGTVRWVIGKFGNETGSNAGSDLVYQRYNDAGTSLGTVMTISRATGNTTFGGSVTATGFIAGSYNDGNWTTAYLWGNHAGAGYVLSSYLSANYYDKTSIDSMVSGFVPDSRAVNTTGSLTGGGNLGASRTLSLINDSSSPGVNKLYGTDGSGNKGWYNQPSGGSGVPTSRVLTINGVSYDLSMDRSWSISTGVSGSGTSFRTAVWNSSSSLVASSIMSDTGSQITISGHLIISGGEFGLGLFSSDPGSPSTGTMYFNTSLGRPRYYNGSSWTTI